MKHIMRNFSKVEWHTQFSPIATLHCKSKWDAVFELDLPTHKVINHIKGIFSAYRTYIYICTYMLVEEVPY